MKVVHLTSAHTAFDVRIFHKECKALAAAGHEVTIVAPHDGDEKRDGIQVRAIRPAASRKDRMTRAVYQVYRTAIHEKADVYHFHDPELMPVGVLLKLHGRRVIYDVHEDYSATVMHRNWIPRPLRPLIARAIQIAERCLSVVYDRVAPATSTIAATFPAGKVCVVQNFPAMSEFVKPAGAPSPASDPKVVYVGGITRVRGACEMIEAIRIAGPVTGAKLLLAGHIDPEIRGLVSAPAVDYLGVLDRPELTALLAQATVGLVTLHPTQNHIYSQPLKLFEYMAAGIPVVASDFVYWRPILLNHSCGVLVDPLSPQAIADAITWLVNNPREAKQMGSNGRRAVQEVYNWEHESIKLVACYSTLSAPPSAP